MIFNNYVANGTVLTSTIWNRAWGFEGTAKSIYDAVGAQQYFSNIYGAFSWGTANQTLTTTDEVLQFNFETVSYPSYERAGSLNNWKNGMALNYNFRDRITIQRDGYYMIHAEFSLNDSSNRICSSTNVDGCTTVPDISIHFQVIDQNGFTVRTTHVRPNVVKAATYNAAENVAPHGSAHLNFIETFQKGDILKLTTDTVDGAARNEKIINASLKAFLIKAVDVNLYTNYYIDPY